MSHIAITTYDLETGGISRVAVYLANHFAAAGHRVTLLLCTSAGDLDNLLKGMLHGNVEYAALGNKRFRRRAAGQIRSLPAYRRWLRAARPDIVIASSNNISWFTGLGFAANPRTGATFFVKTTNPIIREGDGRLLTALRRWGYARLFDNSQRVLTLSDAESRILAGQFPRQSGKFHSVFNPYLSDEFVNSQAAKSAGGAAKPGTTLIAVGRLAKQKNFARLIRAFAIARALDAKAGTGLLTDARVQIAGDGPDCEALMHLAQELGQAGRIDFLGFRSDIPALLHQADMFVLSSNYEGLPAVVIEALGSNCPVVSTDCFPAARELLHGLPGCAVAERNPADLARAILAGLAARGESGDLRARALNYRLDAAGDSHLAAIGLPREAVALTDGGAQA